MSKMWLIMAGVLLASPFLAWAIFSFAVLWAATWEEFFTFFWFKREK